MKSILLAVVVPLGLTVVACGATEDDSGEGEFCEAGHCDGLPFADQLKGRADPIAKFYQSLLDKKVIDSKGVYHGDKAKDIAPAADPLFYSKLLDGVTTVQNCRPGSTVTYALADDLLSGNQDQVYPRIIATVCADTDAVANAFVATLGDPTPDINLEDLEMFAWDATAQRYFFYATKDIGDGNLQVEVEPVRCGKCHTTPRDIDPVGMPRLPIMNELTKPWTHWNAGTGGVSESFFVPDSLKGMPNWEKYGGVAAAASRFEKVIRDANATRVTPSRSKNLFRPAKLDEAMGLIRPLFCDEQVNYVSELATGEITVDAFVSGGTKSAFRAVTATWPWAWYNNDTVQLPVTENAGERLFIVPVRGVAEVTFEPQLYSVLSPNHILAVRALDWKKPVFSDFRCNLWKDALAAFAAAPPKLSGRNRDAVKVLFDEIMKHGGMSIRDIAAGKFTALDEADDAKVKALKDAIAAGSVSTDCSGGFCTVDANKFGELLETYISGIPATPRADLLKERDRRACMVRKEVEPAGAHKDDAGGSGGKIMNDPSFLRIDAGNQRVDTFPASCN